MIDEKIIEAFHMMWESFPGSARLVHKDRTIIAANEIARKNGWEVGLVCSKIATPQNHKGCKANIALSTKTGQANITGEGSIRYWLPVIGCDDVFVHVTINVNAIESI